MALPHVSPASRLATLVVVCLFVWTPLPAQAQSSSDARLTVTVVDQSNAVIPGATVTLVGLEPATKAARIKPARTSTQGSFVAAGLVPGRYSIQAEFPGFELGLVRDVRLKSGENKHVVVLAVQGLRDSVTVTGDKQADASSRAAGVKFGQTLTREEIDALSDDPAEMLRQINDLAGPDAILRVDSFEGAQLPPKSQIKSIHVTRDQFAAETSQAGSTFVDIITQPGVGPVRGGFGMNYQNGNWNAKSPFTPTRGPQADRSVNGNLSGTIARNKADFSISANRDSSYDTPLLYATLPTGQISEVAGLREPTTDTNVNGLFNYAFTRDQTLRIGYGENDSTDRNQGVGLYDLPERAYSEHFRSRNFRIQEAGPIARRFFINTRLNLGWSGDGYESQTEAPTIVVQDEFTSGGAQNAGTQRTLNATFDTDLDYVRGRNSWRTGVEISTNRFHSDQNSDYLGTYTFSSLEDYVAGTPMFFTRNIGNPLVAYSLTTTALYLQDDVRVSKSLTLSPGLRYSHQTHVNDRTGFEPRFGFTWSPFKSGKTSLRASVGIFHGFLNPGIYGMTVQYDGTHQRQLIITDPSYPNAGDVGLNPPTNRYLIDDYKLNRNLRYSTGIDQTISAHLRFSLIYAYMHQEGLPRGENLNAPVNGVRPDPSFANEIESVTDAEIRRHDLNATLALNLSQGGAAANRAPFNWRRLTLNGRFTKIWGRRDGLGPWSVPASGTLDTEWGPVPATTPWNVSLSAVSTQVRNLTVNLTLNSRGPGVYTETTGTDDNHDGLLNDRPAGVGLFSLRTTAFASLNARFNYALNVGHARASVAAQAGANAASTPRYRVSLFASINNITNRSNFVGYSGVVTSTNFMKPTGVSNPRSMTVGMNVGF